MWVAHNIINQCAFVHVGPKNITIDTTTSANLDLDLKYMVYA